jgi:hypothetical protein
VQERKETYYTYIHAKILHKNGLRNINVPAILSEMEKNNTNGDARDFMTLLHTAEDMSVSYFKHSE